MGDRPVRSLTVLWALRIFGPLGSRELADRVAERRDIVRELLAWLVGQGLATNVDPGGYDVSEEGRRLLESESREAARWTKAS